jgi:hypothetical protein
VRWGGKTAGQSRLLFFECRMFSIMSEKSSLSLCSSTPPFVGYVQSRVETVFGFDESVRFFEDEDLIFDTDIPGTLASGYEWTFDPEEGGGFEILLLIDDETEILQG